MTVSTDAPRPVILDCDPGHDDAIALFMALASPKLELRAVTTCAGNQVPEKVFLNARRLLALAGREDVPVARGARNPLQRDLVIAADIHGESGIDGAELPEPTIPADTRSALELMAEVLRLSDRPVTIVATAPLTNVAILLLAHPELSSKIELISIMGGACFGGNITPAAEFNIYVDPEAADIVLRSGVPLALFGLDVTLRAQLHEPDIERIEALGTRTGHAFAGLLRHFHAVAIPPFMAPAGHVEGLHLHDPCPVAYLIEPELFTMLERRVDVVTGDGLTRGETVIDYMKRTDRVPNALVGFDVDQDGIAALVHSSLAAFD